HVEARSCRTLLEAGPRDLAVHTVEDDGDQEAEDGGEPSPVAGGHETGGAEESHGEAQARHPGRRHPGLAGEPSRDRARQPPVDDGRQVAVPDGGVATERVQERDLERGRRMNRVEGDEEAGPWGWLR